MSGIPLLECGTRVPLRIAKAARRLHGAGTCRWDAAQLTAETGCAAVARRTHPQKPRSLLQSSAASLRLSVPAHPSACAIVFVTY